MEKRLMNTHSDRFMHGRTLAGFVLCGPFVVCWGGCGPASRPAGKVVLDCSSTRVLNDFANDRAGEALLRHLSASAAWRVTVHSGISEPGTRVKRVIEAEKRVKRLTGADDWLASSAATQIHVRLWFDPSPPNRLEEGTYVLAKAGAKVVDVPLFAAPDDSHTLGSRLFIQGDSMILEIGEYNLGRERTFTEKAVEQVAQELMAVRDNVEEIERNGYLRKWLPDGSVRESAKDLPLEIREGFMRGIYDVSGYVNPHEKGYITLRTVHVRTGKALEDDVNSWRTVQYVGWSSRPEEKFFFECELLAPSYLTDDQWKMDPEDPRRLEAMAAEQKIRVEVWFHGTQERKLIEATKVLVPWMR
jgi:hypothetical protein